MKRAAVIRHLAFEDLGILAPVLATRRYQVDYIEAGMAAMAADRFDDYDLLVVLGGPLSANDSAAYPFLDDEIALLKRRLQRQQPTLGICLGAQLMARALGAGVTPMKGKEIGYGPLHLSARGQHSLLGELGDDPCVLHWHGEQFSLPDNAVALASSHLCRHQAFALGHFALGLQFHLETDYRRIEQWLIGHCAELAGEGIAPHTIREQALRYGPALERHASCIFNAWLSKAEAEQQEGVVFYEKL